MSPFLKPKGLPDSNPQDVKRRSGIRRLFFKKRALWPTSDGIRYLLLMVGVLLAAVNTGNNLIYLLTAMMLSLIILSGLLSEQSLRKIIIRHRFPRHLFAGQSFSLKILLENKKRYFSSFSLRLKENWAEPVPEIYFSRIPPGEISSQRITLTFRKRGRYLLSGTRLSTSFPFGLFLKTRFPSLVEQIIVYPQIDPLPASFILSHCSPEPGQELSKGAGAVYRSLREYRWGDDSRTIHWKTTARQRRLIVREYETESGNRATLIFDNLLPFACEDYSEDRFEAGVRLAASLAMTWIRQGAWVRFISAQESIPFGTGTDHLYRILHHLALIRVCKQPTKAIPYMTEPAYVIQIDSGKGKEGWPGAGPWKIIRPEEVELPGEMPL